MMQMKRAILILLSLVYLLPAIGQIKVSAPGTVARGEQFRVQFTISSQDVSDFRFDVPKGLNRDMGPSRSSQTSMSIINGKMSQSSSLTLTYILTALEEGSYTIQASATVDGKSAKAAPATLKVVKGSGGGAAQHSPSSSAPHMQDAGSAISGKDLFITVTVDKSKVYEQEAILLTYKVYSLVSLQQLAGDMPDLEGFHTQEIPQSRSMKMEQHNGRNYATVVWSQYVLYPQRSGKLTVPAINFEGIVAQQNRYIDPIDAFFNGGTNIVEVKKTITAPALHIDVLPLPAQPENFSGAVGSFKLSSNISAARLKANDALTYTLTVTGTGNMKLMKAPKVEFPNDFEVYDPKTTDQSKTGKGGATGTIKFEYLAVPRHAGSYTIPATAFCYFDTNTHTYKTLTAEAYTIEVERGSGTTSQHDAGYTRKEDVTQLASDIRYIRLSEVSLEQASDFFGSLLFWCAYILPFLCFVVLAVLFRKQAAANANIALKRNRKANKVATRRLKRAAVLLKDGQATAFYDEVLKALWGYLCDKLSLPLSELNKDNVSLILQSKGVSDSVVEALLALVAECEFARYAPGVSAISMDKVYAEASHIINTIENSVRK